MSRAATFAAALGAAGAAWLSTATLGFTGAAGVRLAILPLSVPVLLLAAAAAAAVAGLRRAGASLLPLALLAFLLLPWLPLSAALGLSSLGVAALALPVDCGADADARLASSGAGGTRRGDPRAAHRGGRDRRSDFRAVGLGCGADDPRGRRAALPDHHAEPAARSLADDRERPPPRRLPRLLRRRAAAARAAAQQGRAYLFGARSRAAGARRARLRARRLSLRWCCSWS